jgi:hypothetical protein
VDLLRPLLPGQARLLQVRADPVAVEHADVAGVIPAFVVERPGGQRLVGVAEADVGPAAEDLALVGRPDLLAPVDEPITPDVTVSYDD